MNNAHSIYISIALDAAQSMLKEIESKYPGCEVNIHPIAMDAVEDREDRVRVLGGDFPVIGMVYHVCMMVMEQACQKYLPTEQQDALWAEFWPETIRRVCSLVVPNEMRPRSPTPPP
jgi:hypothetical protein